jgi:hypothetical protein
MGYVRSLVRSVLDHNDSVLRAVHTLGAGAPPPHPRPRARSADPSIHRGQQQREGVSRRIETIKAADAAAAQVRFRALLP